MAEDEYYDDNGKALLILLLRTMRLGRDPCPPRQLTGFIIQPKVESMEGDWLQAGHVGHNDPPSLSASNPPSAVNTSWVDNDNNYGAIMTARPPFPLLLPHATAVLNRQLAPSRGPPVISSSQFGLLDGCPQT
jgi:hypothetical protein